MEGGREDEPYRITKLASEGLGSGTGNTQQPDVSDGITGWEPLGHRAWD